MQAGLLSYQRNCKYIDPAFPPPSRKYILTEKNINENTCREEFIFSLMRLLQNFSFVRASNKYRCFAGRQPEKLHGRSKTNRVL
jgi:hypothetical protein